MKFIADAMLGRLARRLRLLGFDVLYDPALDDNDIIRMSLEEGRTILTRDTGLASRPLASNRLLIEDDRVSTQVRQVLTQAGITAPHGFLTRCSRCNHPLLPAAKTEVRDLVPDHVYASKNDFLSCAGCGRIYWKGSHVRRMEQKPDVRIR